MPSPELTARFRRSLRQQILELVQPHKGDIASTGTIAPELSGLMSGSAGRMLRMQQQSPLGPFAGSYTRQTAGLTPNQRQAGGMISGMSQPDVPQGLALQSIMNSVNAAGWTPTTGSYAPQQASVWDYMGALQPRGPDWAGPSQQVGGMLGPSIDPGINEPYVAGGPQTRPYNGGGGPGEDGGGHLPLSRTAQVSQGMTTQGAGISDVQGQPGMSGQRMIQRGRQTSTGQTSPTYTSAMPGYGIDPSQFSGGGAPDMSGGGDKGGQGISGSTQGRSTMGSVPSSVGGQDMSNISPEARAAMIQSGVTAHGQGNYMSGPNGRTFQGGTHTSSGMDPNPDASGTSDPTGAAYQRWMQSIEADQSNRNHSPFDVGGAHTGAVDPSQFGQFGDTSGAQMAAQSREAMAQQGFTQDGAGRRRIAGTGEVADTYGNPIAGTSSYQGGGGALPSGFGVTQADYQAALNRAGAGGGMQTTQDRRTQVRTPQSSTSLPPMQPRMPVVPRQPTTPAQTGPQASPTNGSTQGSTGPLTPNPSPGPGLGNGGPNVAATNAITAPQTPQGGYTLEGSPGVTAAYRQVSGENVTSDPAIAAAMQHYRTQVQPGIENSMALAGLGRSTAAGNAQTQAESNMLLPLYQDSFARQERTNAQGSAAMEAELQRRERGGVRSAEAMQAQVPQLLALSQMNTGNRNAQMQAYQQYGGLEQQNQQQQYDAQYDDFLRRQALSEQALMVPFGGTLPSAFGSKTTGGK